MTNRPHPKVIAQQAWDNGHAPTFLTGLCELIMCAEPTPLSPEMDAAVKHGADMMAQKVGFTDWVEAYHGLSA